MEDFAVIIYSLLIIICFIIIKYYIGMKLNEDNCQTCYKDEKKIKQQVINKYHLY